MLGFILPSLECGGEFGVITTVLSIFALTGGTILCVLSKEMIPEIHSGGRGKVFTYSPLEGFSLMLIFDAFFKKLSCSFRQPIFCIRILQTFLYYYCIFP